MNLQKVNPPRPDVNVLCCRCHSWERSDKAWVDLDGKAFERFYCADCYAFATQLGPRPEQADS